MSCSSAGKQICDQRNVRVIAASQQLFVCVAAAAQDVVQIIKAFDIVFYR